VWRANNAAEVAITCYAALKQVFVQHAGGAPDEDVVRRVMVLCRALRTLVNDDDCQRQIALIEDCAPAYFSEQEHLKWSVGSTPGVQFLRLHIIRALILFHSHLNRMEAARRIREVLPGLLENIEAELDRVWSDQGKRAGP
jgi:hypothetical protein